MPAVQAAPVTAGEVMVVRPANRRVGSGRDGTGARDHGCPTGGSCFLDAEARGSGQNFRGGRIVPRSWLGATGFCFTSGGAFGGCFFFLGSVEDDMANLASLPGRGAGIVASSVPRLRNPRTRPLVMPSRPFVRIAGDHLP